MSVVIISGFAIFWQKAAQYYPAVALLASFRTPFTGIDNILYDSLN